MADPLQILNDNLSGGRLQLGFQDLRQRDIQRILIKLLETEAVRSSISCAACDSSHVWKVNLAGNRNLGDGVTDYLHLLPDTICDLDLSYCGLSTKGVRNVCKFMESNRTITRLVLWGNIIDDRGAIYIRDMLKRNSSLQDFCCYNDPPISTKRKILIADSLECNSTLRMLALDDCTGAPPSAAVYSKFRSVLERAGSDSAIETLKIGAINRDPNSHKWEETVRRCDKLCHFGSNSSRLAYNPKFMYWRDLNIHNARRITREGNDEDFLLAVEKAANDQKINVMYYLLRNNVEHISIE